MTTKLIQEHGRDWNNQKTNEDNSKEYWFLLLDNRWL